MNEIWYSETLFFNKAVLLKEEEEMTAMRARERFFIETKSYEITQKIFGWLRERGESISEESDFYTRIFPTDEGSVSVEAIEVPWVVVEYLISLRGSNEIWGTFSVFSMTTGGKARRIDHILKNIPPLRPCSAQAMLVAYLSENGDCPHGTP